MIAQQGNKKKLNQISGTGQVPDEFGLGNLVQKRSD